MSWFHATWDDREVVLSGDPPGGEPWEERFPWSEIVRVCFEGADLYDSDKLYIFIRGRPESYVVLTEQPEGSALWKEIIRRGIFDAGLAIKASTGTGLHCWPPPDQPVE